MNKWRIPTWVILIWTGLMVVLVFTGLQGVQRGQSAAYAAGVGLGITLLFMIWFAGFIILSIVWFMTRPRHIGAADELARLQAARDGGVLTPEQYQQAAAQLAGPVTPQMEGKAGQNMKCGRCGKPLSPAWKWKCQHCGAQYAEFNPMPRS